MTHPGFDGPEDAAIIDAVARLLAAHPGKVLPLVHAGAPVLRRTAVAYTGQLGELLPQFLEWMRETMLAAPGVGLAAPQIGVPLAIAVIHDKGSDQENDPRERPPVAHRTIINPVYTPVPGHSVPERCSFFEGCLSVPGYQAVVARYRSVHLTALDETGTPVDEVLGGWPARIVQHETDHLHGQLYLDHAEVRSLSTNENLVRYWAGQAVPTAAGAALGFDVAQASADGAAVRP